MVGTYTAVTDRDGRDCRGNVYLSQLLVGGVAKVTTGQEGGSGCHLYAKGTFRLEVRTDERLSFSGVVEGALDKA
jgi:hypothetical protein